MTALHCAASRGHSGCIDTIIGLCGAPTDLIDSNGCTALHYAVTLGHADATSLLLAKEADANRQDRKGRTPAHCGCAKGQFETVKILHSRRANLWLRNARGDLPVHEAASSGRRELVQWLLEQRPKQVNTTSNDGRSLLHTAAANDNTAMCKMLIDYGADVNSIYRTMRNVVLTPLDCALQKGHRSTAKFLQLHGGLPAGKLRLSGRNNVSYAVNDQELVKPLKFDESTTGERRDPPSTRESSAGKTNDFVVYVKRSDSESSCEGDSGKQRTGQKKKNEESCTHHQQHRHNHQKNKHSECPHEKKRHKSKERRRTSSCSDTFLAEKDQSGDSGDDANHLGMNRCKSNMEIRRRHKSKETCCPASRSSSCSTGSESEGSPDDEKDRCKHRKTRKHQKNCRRYKVSVRRQQQKKGKSPVRSEKEEDREEEKKTRSKSKERVEMCDKDTQSVDIPYEAPRNESKGQDNKSPSRPPSTSSISSVKKRPQSARVSSAQRQQQNAQLEAVDCDNDLAQIEKEFLPQKVVSLTEILDNKPTAASSELLSLVNEQQSSCAERDQKLIAGNATGTPRGRSTTPQGKGGNAVKGAMETKAGDDDGAESDVTFIMEQPDGKDKSTAELPPKPVTPSLPTTTPSVTFSPDIPSEDRKSAETREQIPGNEICQQPEESQENSTTLDEVKIQRDASQKENCNKPQTPSDASPTTPQPPPTPPPPTSPDTRQEKLQRQPSQGSSKSSRRQKTTNSASGSFAVLPNVAGGGVGESADAAPGDSPMRSSIKVAPSSGNPGGENPVKSVSISESRPTSFKVLTDGRRYADHGQKSQSISTDDDEQPVSTATLISGGGGAADDDRSRMKRLKKRNKSRDSLERNQPSPAAVAASVVGTSSPTDRAFQVSRDQDSGFEPSPRAPKSKIPRAINHEQEDVDGRSSRRDGFIILDEMMGSKGPRAASEGRKPGDKNACNMAVVNASIQKNIRRCGGAEEVFLIVNAAICNSDILLSL